MKFQDNIWTAKMCPAMQYSDVIKIQDGERPPFWRSLNHHISVKNRPILIQFGTLQQRLNPMTVTWSKIEISKIQDGGGRHLENRFLTITHRPNNRFQRIFFVRGTRTSCRQRPREKNCKFLKSKVADGRHFDKKLCCRKEAARCFVSV